MIDAGDKYIIELEAAYGFVHGEGLENVPTLYRVKGFRSLVFDQQGLEKLVPLDQMRPSWWYEAYKKGLDDAWLAARKLFEYCHADINNAIFDGKAHCGMSAGRMARVALNTLPPAKVIAKIRDYEEKKAEDEAVKVGDEVKDNGGFIFVVVKVFDGGKRCAGYNSKGEHIATDTVRCRTTGRHFPEIAAVLEQMKGE